jgi:DNA-directed RNA polymerase specialized sigma24 family protein
LWLYRERTVGLLRRYLRLSVEVGRLPSLLGREFFRSRVTSYSAATFEDAVIFVHDVERSLEKLDWFEQRLIATIVLQEYSRWEAARILNCGMRTIGRLLPEALDRLSEIFLRGGILEKLVDVETAGRKSCQEGGMEENVSSYCNDCENIF